jgi:hypothetical protein
LWRNPFSQWLIVHVSRGSRNRRLAGPSGSGETGSAARGLSVNAWAMAILDRDDRIVESETPKVE